MSLPTQRKSDGDRAIGSWFRLIFKSIELASRTYVLRHQATGCCQNQPGD